MGPSPSNMPPCPSAPAQTWLWVTKSAEPPGEGWWSCARGTRRGDLALVYRTAPAKDIAYLARVESTAAPVAPDSTVPTTTGYECNYAILTSLPTPLPFGQLKQDPALANWPALAINFTGSAHPVPADVWTYLLKHGSVTPRRLAILVAARSAEYRLECELEEYLVTHPDVWKQVGLRLELVAQQRRLINGLRPDLVYRTRTGRRVVVELKRGTIDQDAVDQVRRYQECMQLEQPRLRRPLGILVGEPPQAHVARAINRARRLRYVDVAKLGVSRTSIQI